MFICPGLGHMAAGWRVTGAIMAVLTFFSAFIPLATFVWGVATPPECWTGFWACGKETFVYAWHLTWPRILMGIPVFAVMWTIGFLHGNTLSIPDRNPS